MSVDSQARDIDEVAFLIAPSLVVARLGEADHHGWWGSNGASPTGAFVLEDRFPRTRRILGLEIALVAAERRHDEEFGAQDDFVHLFSAGLGVARLSRAWLAEHKTETDEAELVGALHSGGTSDLEALVPEPLGPSSHSTFGNRVRIGEIRAGQLEDPASRRTVVQRLARAFLDARGTLPYFELVGAT